MGVSDQLDEVYDRIHVTGPEFDGWLSNHAPMAADALIRIGRSDRVDMWLDGYLPGLDALPGGRWPIGRDEWQEALGDPKRLGDWIVLFTQQLTEQPWQQVLTVWWPRLLPGGVAAATHPLIRTGHAVRALTEQHTAHRLAELAHALGYWGARWQPLPQPRTPAGRTSVRVALESLPVITADGDIRSRIARLGDDDAWPAAQARLRPLTDPSEVPTALDALTDAAVGRYPVIAHGNPVMLVHSATAPRAARLALEALPPSMWIATHHAAWSISAAVTAIYTPAAPPPPTPPPASELAAPEIADLAAEHGDEHVIKFSEVAIESHRRGNPDALPAALHAIALINDD